MSGLKQCLGLTKAYFKGTTIHISKLWQASCRAEEVMVGLRTKRNVIPKVRRIWRQSRKLNLCCIKEMCSFLNIVLRRYLMLLG